MKNPTIDHQKHHICSAFGMSTLKYKVKKEEFLEYLIEQHQTNPHLKLSQLGEVMIKDVRHDLLGELNVPLSRYEIRLFFMGALYHEILNENMNCQIKAEMRSAEGT